MSIANNWDWTFDYETFADFDAPFRNSYYNRSSTSAKEAYHVVRDAFVPLAPPVIVEVKP